MSIYTCEHCAKQINKSPILFNPITTTALPLIDLPTQRGGGGEGWSETCFRALFICL